MKLFELSISTLIIRYYLMMAIVIVSFFIGMPILSILALFVFFSALVAVKFDWKWNKATRAERALTKEAKVKRAHQPAH